jgi:hypothetical protein
LTWQLFGLFFEKFGNFFSNRLVTLPIEEIKVLHRFVRMMIDQLVILSNIKNLIFSFSNENIFEF